MRRVILAIVSTVAGLVLLLGFKSHSAGSLAAPTGIHGSLQSGTGSTSSGSASSGSSRTVSGDAAGTPYGPVQVQIKVAGGKLTDVSLVEYPNGTARDVEINNYALPQLIQESLSANSAHIDMVSGATFTSMGYIQSLQSALDKAGV